MSELAFERFGDDSLGSRGVVLPEGSDQLLVALEVLDGIDKHRKRLDRLIILGISTESVGPDVGEDGIVDGQVKS